MEDSLFLKKIKMTTSPQEYYQSRIQEFSKSFEKLKEKANKISGIRIISFIIGFILIYYTATISSTAVIISSSLFVMVFGYIVYYHHKIHKQKYRAETLLKINHAEANFLKGNYSAFKDGAEFQQADHPFADDLDLFGKNSLYHAINRCSTLLGSQKLANWFKTINTNHKTIIEKQKAILEISSEAEWRQEFQFLGYSTKDEEKDQQNIKDWVHTDNGFNTFGNKMMVIIIPSISFMLLGLSIANIIPTPVFFTYICFPLLATWHNSKKINLTYNQLGKKTDLLKKYAGLLAHLERKDFNSAYLKSIKSGNNNHIIPSKVLRSLSKISSAFDNRLNMLAGILLNMFLLWDLLQCIRLDIWKKKYGHLLPQWFDMISEYDALLSLATYHYNQPDNVFPSISEKGFEIQAKELGHPLILKPQRVDNDVSFHDWKDFVIITGANMAGKSTFLRTLGVNMVLASMGSSVCAKSFKWSPVEIFTSLRTKDSLDKNESYFFAELKRLKAIIDLLNDGKKLFIILDEILKGTNSKDKQSGSMKLIKQLIGLKASGIIATHDLVLGELIKTYPDHITNKCFEVDIIDGNLHFDYKLRDGISQNMNATFLMKKMGITF